MRKKWQSLNSLWIVHRKFSLYFIYVIPKTPVPFVNNPIRYLDQTLVDFSVFRQGIDKLYVYGENIGSWHIYN